MASYLSVLFQCDTPARARILADMLERATRPVFDDDLPEEERPLFRVVEDIEFPVYTEVNDNEVLARWDDVEGFAIRDLLPLIKLGDVDIVLAHEIPDDPLSFDEDLEDGWYWRKVGDKYEACSPKEISKHFGKKMIKRVD